MLRGLIHGNCIEIDPDKPHVQVIYLFPEIRNKLIPQISYWFHGNAFHYEPTVTTVDIRPLLEKIVNILKTAWRLKYGG